MGDDGTQVEIRTPNDKRECREAPPRPTRMFPVTDAEDWCGEHPQRGLTAGAG